MVRSMDLKPTVRKASWTSLRSPEHSSGKPRDSGVFPGYIFVIFLKEDDSKIKSEEHGLLHFNMV